VAGVPQGDAWVQKLCWPHNGPLWYIQSLLFCWLTYPLLRQYLTGPDSVFHRNRGLTLVEIVSWWILGILPAVFMLVFGVYSSSWLFCKVFPLFMIPPFYLGVAVCDLYKQELAVSAEEEGSEDGGQEDERGGVWGQVKQNWSAVLGETVLLAWIGFQLVPYAHSESHVWGIVFGAVLFFLALAAAEKGAGFHMGVKWILESEFVVMLGDASLCAFTFQFPVAKIYYWALKLPVSGAKDSALMYQETSVQSSFDMRQHWMLWYEFALFIVALYVLAIYLGKYVDKPASAWIQDRLVAAVK